MSNIYLYILSLGIVFASFTNQETGWSFDQSTAQAFFIFETIEIDNEVVIGDGCSAQEDSCYCAQNPGECDVIGAFFNDICIGWIYADSAGYTTVPAMGNDGGEYSANYPQNSDFIYFRIYDASQDIILHFDSEEDLDGQVVANGVTCTDSSGENPGDCTWVNFGIYMCADFSLDNDIIPVDYTLLSAYPNPFNPSLNINFSIDEYALVNIKIYDLLGSLLETLISNEAIVAGNHSIIWNPGGNITSGEYIISLTVNGNQIATQKVAYIK